MSALLVKPAAIFLDMDGVLCDFVGGVAQLFNVDKASLDSWNLFDIIGITPGEFWKTIDNVGAPFWESLAPFSWTHELVAACRQVTATVYLATSAGKSEHAYAGKILWLKKHLPDFLSSGRIFMCCDKYWLAGPDRLLIDDNNDNCNKFNALGGAAILFPQPWNDRNGGIAEDVLVELSSLSRL